MKIKEERHPCFASGCKSGRIHLPVAPICNIQCNYCKREFDCLNESRPGVTSRIMSPEEACGYYKKNKKIYNLAVAGVAGPGDALANWKEVKKTFGLIRNINKDCAFCISTNGLLIPRLSAEIKDTGIEYVTVTINSLEKGIGAQIYEKVIFDNTVKTGDEAAGFLIDRQMEGIEILNSLNIKIKINFVLIPGVNENQVEAVAKFASKNRVALMNIIPLIPIEGTKFEKLKISHLRRDISKYQNIAAKWVPIMKHCIHCRADAVGYL